MKRRVDKASLSVANIAELSAPEVAHLSTLAVDEDQEDLGGTFDDSVQEWRGADAAGLLGLVFRLDQDPVGLVLIKRPPLAPDWVRMKQASVHGLKIARGYQGFGLGRTAFGLTIGAVKDHWPDTEALVLAVDAGNEPALAVYRGAGMQDSGPIYRGRIGLEHRLVLPLA
jgi:ribosomal protein S18 acetylase RimI-like enzyme